jgi:Tol biopolymer transport system component
MKQKVNLVRSVFMILLLLSNCAKQSDSPIIKGLYLGQTPPGDVPKVFAPETVSSIYWEHSGAVFTPDGKELFWSRAINEGREPRIIVIMYMKQKNGIWTQPELAPFNLAPYNHINSISPDGKRLYFFTEQDDQPGKAWVVDKTENGWSKPRLLKINTIDNPNTVINEVHETGSKNLYLYGPNNETQSGRGIISSRYVDGKYTEYESLGSNINFDFNDPFPNHSPTVDPDEKFVIFVSRRPGGYGTQDLYISYRQSDDTWGLAINLGPKINTIGAGNSWPQLSPDGKYLFFTSRTKPFNENDIKEKNILMKS